MAASFDVDIRFVGNGTLSTWSLLSFVICKLLSERRKTVLASSIARYLEEQASAWWLESVLALGQVCLLSHTHMQQLTRITDPWNDLVSWILNASCGINPQAPGPTIIGITKPKAPNTKLSRKVLSFLPLW